MMDPVDSSTFVPPPRVPPRGLVGLLDDYDPNATLDTSQFAPGEVFLNIYDLGGQQDETVRQINQVSMANNNMLLGGIFHAAVEVYGVEWSYGFNDRETSGVSQIAPRTHPQHTYRSTVPLGVTNMGEAEVEALLERLAKEWESSTYDPIHHNSLNFCHALCLDLGAGRIPGWVDRASRTASFLDQTSKTAAEGALEAAEIARTVKNEVEQTVRSTLENVDEDVLGGATEAMETLRRESIRAVEVVSAQTQELADALPVHAQVLGGAMQQHALVVGERVQQHGQVLGEAVQQHAQIMGEKAQEILGDDIAQQAQEIAGKTKEHAQALGRSLWSRAHELVSGPAATGRSNDLWDSALGGLGLLGGAAGAQAQQQQRADTQERQQQQQQQPLFERAPMGGAPRDQCFQFVCRAGHAMQPWRAEAGTCDGCGDRIKDGQVVMDCRPCDWYLCGACCQRVQFGTEPSARSDTAATPETSTAAAAAAVTAQSAAAMLESPAAMETQAVATPAESTQKPADPADVGKSPAEAAKVLETNIADDEQE
mmetsp:Transcript_18403/g.35486  ORF Transcript_18403/g.35486 Transcript_18403/m.35486 type:complete len:540 (-) Transcript_18403:61-1680(-)